MNKFVNICDWECFTPTVEHGAGVWSGAEVCVNLKSVLFRRLNFFPHDFGADTGC